MKRKQLLPFIITGILCVVAGAYVGIAKLKPAPLQASATENLFAMSLPDQQGKTQKLSQWKDKTLLVNFWATWCAPCVQEMPELSSLQAEVASKNIQIIGIGVDSQQNISEFSQKYHIDYPLYAAGMNAAALSRQFGNQAGGLPFTLLIGSDGQVKKTYLGRLKIQELRKDLNL